MDTTKKRKLEAESELLSCGDAGGVEQPQQELERSHLLKLLEPLDREAMHAILQQACLHHPDVLQEVRGYVDRDPAHRKLFVRGLGWATDNESLKAVFSAYGEIDEAIVIMDKATQKSRGFGFVTFRHMDSALRALKEPSKKIDGRVTVCQFAAWESHVPTPQEDVSLRKIYVGNVPSGLAAEKVLALFSQFGEIAEGPLGFDKTTGLSRGFALIIYKTSEGARNALLEPFKTLEGQQVHCKIATEGHKNVIVPSKAPAPPHPGAAAPVPPTTLAPSEPPPPELTNRVATGAPPTPQMLTSWQPGQANGYAYVLQPGTRYNYGQPFYGNPVAGASPVGVHTVAPSHYAAPPPAAYAVNHHHHPPPPLSHHHHHLHHHQQQQPQQHQQQGLAPGVPPVGPRIQAAAPPAAAAAAAVGGVAGVQSAAFNSS